MNRRFNQIFRKARKPENIIPLNSQNCFVIFSDQHKGDKSAADDFKKNANLYESALSYYKQRGFRLIVLGDSEEIWENSFSQIVNGYRDLIQKEIEMAPTTPDQKRIRVWGNHDKEVTLHRFKKYCQRSKETLLEDVSYQEGLCLGEDIFLVHGHQGRFFEDIAWKISRWAIKNLWKTAQKMFHIGQNGAARDFEIQEKIERSYYQWAKKKRLMLVCGHTHRAVFGSLSHYDHLQFEILYLQKLLKENLNLSKQDIIQELHEKKSELDKILDKRSGNEPKSFDEELQRPVPCYFNDGCCCYADGITCLEIERGAVHLIQWKRQGTERVILGEGNIQQILSYIKEARPVDEALEPKLKNI